MRLRRTILGRRLLHIETPDSPPRRSVVRVEADKEPLEPLRVVIRRRATGARTEIPNACAKGRRSCVDGIKFPRAGILGGVGGKKEKRRQYGERLAAMVVG